MSVTPEPTVLVATETENVIRIYAGHPRNGGVHQTGQLTINRAVEPTDLANIALDLSNTFGWLAPQPTAHIVDVSQHARAITAPSLALVAGDGVALIPCPMKGCGLVVRSDNLPRHLMSKKHGLSKQTASVRARLAREATRNGTPPEPAPVKEPRKEPRGTAVWKQMVACPECGRVVSRNNMTTHLQGKQHGYTKERANEVARALPNQGTTRPRGAQPDRVQRHGIAGARELENVLYPMVLRTLADAPEPMTAQEVATAMHQRHQTVKSWMQRLHKAGRVDRIEPERPNEPLRYMLPAVAPAPPAPEPITEPVGTLHAVDAWAPTMYDVGSQHIVDERNPTP